MHLADQQWRARKHQRDRKNGTRYPICVICGLSDWRVRYERHHIAMQEHDDYTLMLCKTHHDWISDMQKDHLPLPENTPPHLARLIGMARGAIEIDRARIAYMSEMEGHLVSLACQPGTLIPPATEGAGDDR